MSVIQKIRDKGGWIIFGLIAIALISFILQDAFKHSGNGPSTITVIGKVNGEDIQRADFQSKMDFYDQMGKQQHRPYEQSQLVTGVWEQLVSKTIINQEAGKLGLSFTAKELSDVLFGNNPPDWAKQQFTDPKTGQYNADVARQQFAELKKNPSSPNFKGVYDAYIQPTIDQTMSMKYHTLITQAVYVPKWMAEKTNADNNSLAKISYVSIPYTSVSDSAVKVTDDEIEAYLKKHQKVYEQKDETRQVAYVTFNASASAQDTAALVAQLNALKPGLQAVSNNDIKLFLSTKGSEVPYYNSYLSKSVLKQKVNDSLFNLPVGGVYGPYLDANNYVIAKMVDIKTLPDSVKVRHILVATQQQDPNSGELIPVRADSTAKKRLDSAIAEINSGKSFDSVCLKYSDDGTRDKGGVYDYFASGSMVEEFNDFAFNGKVGDKKTVQTMYGFHYVEILGQKGQEPAYKIAYIAKPISASQETINSVNTAAVEFAATSRDKNQFDANAAKQKKQVTTTQQGIKENDFTIDALGECRDLIKWAYEKNNGDVSEPIKVGENYVVAIVTGINKAGLPAAQAERPQVEPLVRNEKKAKIIIDTKIKGSTLEAIAQNAGTTVNVADSVSFSSLVIPVIGNEVNIIGAAFNKQIQGKASAPVAGTSGVFAVKGEGIFAKPSLNGNTDMQQKMIQAQIVQQLTGNQYKDIILEALKKSADIKDYRSEVY